MFYYYVADGISKIGDNKMNDYHYIVRIKVKQKEDAGNSWFGRGVADLLHGVEKYHSLNMAAQQMGMAYSKAWRIVRDAEKAMKIPLLNRMGKQGSELTPEAEKLLKVYEEAQLAAWRAVDAVMEQYYGNGKNGDRM